jgi:D-alanyl-D-alanine carboxypeptidase
MAELRKRSWIALAFVTVGLLALTGCGADATTPAASTHTPTSSATPTTNASACVPDPHAVAECKPGKASTGKLPAALSATLDAAASAAFAATAVPGVVVGVRTPQGTWTKAYGVADITTNEPLTTDVHHRVGSVTKTFTGTIIMQLVSDEKIALTDPISKYVPNVPNGSNITILQLANMTSGLADYTHDPAFQKLYFGGDYSIVWSVDQVLATAFAMQPAFAPGAGFHYSNTNTVLLGQVIEKVTGHRLADELKRRIFTPLRLTGTSYPGGAAIIPTPHAHGYTNLGIVDGVASANAPRVDATAWNVSQAGASGAIISRADDLLTYARALGTGQGLLPEAAQVKRLSSFPEPAGYGIGLNCVQGWVGHNGLVPGYNTELEYDTRTDTTVVVEANGDLAAGTPEALPAGAIFTAVAAALGRPLVAADPRSGDQE